MRVLFRDYDLADLGLQNSSMADRKLIPNQSVLGLMARTSALQDCMSLIPKTKTGHESGSKNLGNHFIFNDMAEEWDSNPLVNVFSTICPATDDT
jgi:hypothetical protein